MQTVLFTIRYGFVARNVLRTGILRGLKAAGARVVVVTPAFNEPYLNEEAADQGFELLPFPPIRSSTAELMFSSVSNSLLFDHPMTTTTTRVKWRRLPAQGRWGVFAAKAAVAPLHLHRLKWLREAAERIDASRFRHPEVGTLLDAVRPSLVVTTDLFAKETHFVREARQRGIPTVGLVKSWDNLTSKTRVRVGSDFYVVWNHIMLEEFERLHFVDGRRVFVAGAPNFDFFASPAFTAPSREEFFRKLGTDPHRKLVVYSPGNKLTYSDDRNIRTLHAALTELESEFPFHLHIRKYPKSAQGFDHLKLPHVSIGEAGVVVPVWADHVDQPKEHMQFLGELMHHADLLVHIGSTVAVDAACFNTPIIGYGLDARAHGSRWHYAPWVFDLTHNRYLTDLKGQRVVYSAEELRAAIRTYFAHPELDREGRRRMVDAVCGAFDGHAGDRIAAFLLGVMRGEGTIAMRSSLKPSPVPG